MRRRWSRTVLTMAALGFLVAAAPAAAITYAPVDQPGPALTPAATDLQHSLVCTGDVANAAREPVLLLGATGVDTQQNYSYNYEKAFTTAGVPYCTSDEPGALGENMDDIQLRGEYVVYAIRRMHQLAGRPIAILGHSQGGMVMRWALRFWPDTRPMVADVIGMAGSNHGTNVAAVCAVQCAAAEWQQGSGSNFTAALNSGQETFAGIDYTEIYTHDDEIVTPNQNSTGSSSVHGPGRITDVAVQDICPLDPSDHLLLGTADPVAYALVIDALTHDGPADPARIATSVCTQGLMPAIDPVTFPSDSAASTVALETAFTTYPQITAEPPLACYATASCPGETTASGSAGSGGTSGASGGGRPASTTCLSRRRFVVHLDGRGMPALSDVSVTIAGRRARIAGARGHRTVTVDLRGTTALSVTVRIRGRTRHGRRLTVTRRYHTCAKR
jgi:pimeloyl-ACP methyl ester carboxylesterase